MNTSTLFEIETNAQSIMKISEFIDENPEYKWMLNLLDQPFQLALQAYRAGLNRDPPAMLPMKLAVIGRQ